MSDAIAKSTMMANLMAAFNGESNASARYAAFAKKADEEGYGQAASLFRAASKAEEFHARNHAQVITKLGGTAKAEMEAIVVKSTRENLGEAIAGETYEKDVMYPKFIAEAKAEGKQEAVRTFHYAMAAEIEHAALYTDVLAHLAEKRAAMTYHVCPVCGKTVTAMEFTACPVCFTPQSKFLAIQ
jgi:rubrerythrin